MIGSTVLKSRLEEKDSRVIPWSVAPIGILQFGFGRLSSGQLKSVWLFSIGDRAGSDSAISTRGMSSAVGSGSSRKKVLIVDDEMDNALVFKSGLEKNSFSVDAFSDPLVALASFRPDFYDTTLLDVRMPAMTDFELYGEMKKIDDDLRACFISAFEIHRDEIRRYLPQANEFKDSCIVKNRFH